MNKTRTFMHMLGLAAKADDDEEETTAMDDEEETRAMDDDDEDHAGDEDREDGAKDGDDDEARAEGDDDEQEADDDDGEQEARARVKAARVAERARCAEIFAAGVSAGMPELAGTLAADTDMNVAGAKAVIKSAKKAGGKSPSLASLMAGVEIPNVGAEASPGSAGGEANAVVQKAMAAYNRATGKSDEPAAA